MWEPEYEPSLLETTFGWIGIGTTVFKPVREPTCIENWTNWMSTEYPKTYVILALLIVAASPLIPNLLCVVISLSHFVVFLSLAILSAFGRVIGRMSWKSIVLIITPIFAIILYVNCDNARIIFE